MGKLAQVSDNVEKILSQLTSDIERSSYETAIDRLSKFKKKFEFEINRQDLTDIEQKALLSQFGLFEQLVTKISENKKSLSKEIAQFKRNNTKINKYIQHK